MADEPLDLTKPVDQLNAIFKTNNDPWFICTQCRDLIILKYAVYRDTPRWGRDQPFCDACVRRCKHCHKKFSSRKRYMHENCYTDSDSDSDSYCDSSSGSI